MKIAGYGVIRFNRWRCARVGVVAMLETAGAHIKAYRYFVVQTKQLAIEGGVGGQSCLLLLVMYLGIVVSVYQSACFVLNIAIGIPVLAPAVFQIKPPT